MLAENTLFETVVSERRSVRGYLDKRVPQEVLDKVFALAQRAPSNCNIQPWKVYVASGEVKDRLRAELVELVTTGAPKNPDFPYPGKFQGEYRKRQVDCAVELYNNMSIGRDDKDGRARAALRNYEFFDAPHVLWVGMHKNFGTTVALDVGMYLQTLMLSMTAHGIASCAQGALRYHPEAIKRAFDVPEDINILVGLSFGYEDTSVPANKTRIEREDISESVWFRG